jgi:glycosyltransferase involved in cell wall biosynthesis
LFGLVRNFALHRLFSKVDYFLAIGQASRRFYLRHGVPEGKLVDAPYGVDNEFFRCESERIRGLRDYGTTGLMEEGARQEARGEGGEQPNAADQETKRPRDEKEEKGAGQKAIGTGEGNLKLKTPAEIRSEWNIPLDAKLVMFCGKFVGKKRPGDLVEATALHQRQAAWGKGQRGGEGTGLVARGERQVGGGSTSSLEPRASSPLCEAQQSWHLLFVGSGELGEELRAACDVRFDEETAGKGREASCEGGKDPKQGETSSLEPLASSHARPPASFAGFLNQSEISKAYAVADVVVLPSEAWETWGLVVNEATAAGVPTVVSDRCGCADDFGAKNPYTRVFPTGDVAAMARAIEEVLALEAQPEEVTKFAEAFSPRITAEAVVARLRTTELATDQHG